MFDYNFIGARIRIARKKNDLTLRDLANQLGISYSHLSHIEKGGTYPSCPLLLKICSSLNLTPNDLLVRYRVDETESDFYFSYLYNKFCQLNPNGQAIIIKTINQLDKIDELKRVPLLSRSNTPANRPD